MTFRLKLLGCAGLFSDAGPVVGRATQRRRIALLALLGAAGPGGASRDRLMSLLWPEADAERGRHLLSDSVYRINQSLDGDAIVAVGDALALNLERVGSDLAEFNAAVEEAEWGRAVALYGGPLLDGFHISDAAEFERWVDSERDRLAAQYARALEQLAGEREAAGDTLGALDSTRALAAHDPLSSRYALRYMRALDTVGDRASAIRHARVHASLVTQELGVAPDYEVEAFAQQLSAAPTSTRSDVAAAPAMRASDGLVDAPPVPTNGSSDEPGATVGPRAAEPALTSDGSVERRPGTRLRVWAAAAAGVLLLAVAVAILLFGGSDRELPPSGPTTILVLPFANLSPGDGQEYLSDGITEELIASLARVPGLKVVARTSSFAFKGKAIDIREVGVRLGVETVLEGSVRSSGDALRISARLVNVSDGYPLWSETYERKVDDAFAIQDEIAQQIVMRMRAPSDALPASAVSAGPVDPVAYELYLKGRYAWHQRTEAGLLASAEYLENAVRLAPRYARGHAGLGEAYAVLGFYDYMPPAAAFPRGARAAHRALELDSGLASPYATLGYVALYHDWDFLRSERFFLRAIAADPGYSTAHQWYGNLLTAMGRFAEAEAAMRTAMELDPLSLIANAALGWVHYYAGDPDRAIEQLDRTLELDADFLLARMWKGQAYSALGRHDSSVAILEDVVRRSRRTALSLAVLAHARAASGDAGGARALLAELVRREGGAYIPSFEIARVHVALGDHRRGLEWLERAARERSHSIAFLTVDPALAALRGDPRFATLVRLRTPSGSSAGRQAG